MPFKETVNPEEQSREIRQFKYDWSNKTILVAEDEIFNYMFIKEIFDPTHVKLLKANNGKEAVEQIEKNEDVSLVLMDIKMPVMDGYTATRLIKEMKPEKPVIAQTAYAFSEDVEKARDAGFDTYLSKPIEREKLMKVVDDYFSKK
jgi:CheY-like chemotaxis protein